MKIVGLSFLLAFIVTHAIAVELPVDAGDDPVPSTKSPSDPTGTPSDFVGSKEKKSLDMHLSDAKAAKLVSLKLKEVDGAVLALFETSKLPQSNFAMTVEGSCTKKGPNGSAAAVEKSVKELKVRGNFYSDEFRIKGYSLRSDGDKTLEGKVLKLYKVSKDQPPEQIACGKVSQE